MSRVSGQVPCCAPDHGAWCQDHHTQQRSAAGRGVVSALRRICPQGAPSTACRAVDGRALLAANPDLYGRTALQILKTIVDAAGAQGLYVIVDAHRSQAGWGPQENGLWYGTAHGYPPSSWVRAWQRVVRLFAHDPALTGVDLFNELHSVGDPRTCAAYLADGGATWGQCHGRRNQATDWRAAATDMGNLVLRLNPHLLIAVEGTSVAQESAGSAPLCEPIACERACQRGQLIKRVLSTGAALANALSAVVIWPDEARAVVQERPHVASGITAQRTDSSTIHPVIMAHSSSSVVLQVTVGDGPSA